MGVEVVYEADQRYFPTGANSGTYTCLNGHFAGIPLTCAPNDCSASIPNGDGYNTECDNFKTGETCTQHCTGGWYDNNAGRGQHYTCDGGVFMGVVLECFPDPCKSQLPFRADGELADWGLSHQSYTTSCDTLVTNGPECTLACTQGYTGFIYTGDAGEALGDLSPSAEATESSSAGIPALLNSSHLVAAESVGLTCPNGVIAGGTFFCQPNDCTAATPKGLGYGPQCDTLVTDSHCHHEGNAGYTCNDYGGKGRDYSCPQGFWDGVPLNCTADPCTAEVPTGNGYGSECENLVTDGSCNHTCSVGWEDPNATNSMVQLYTCFKGVFDGVTLNCSMTPTTAAAAEQSRKKQASELAGGIASGVIFSLVLLTLVALASIAYWKARKIRKAAEKEANENGNEFHQGEIKHSDFWEKMRAMKEENEMLKTRLHRLTNAWRGKEAPQLPGMAFANLVDDAVKGLAEPGPSPYGALQARPSTPPRKQTGMPASLAIAVAISTLCVLVAPASSASPADLVFQPKDIPKADNVGATALGVADFGGTPDLDIACIASGEDTVYWLRWQADANAPNGQYEYKKETVDTTSKAPMGLGIADLDADGQQDLVVAYVQSNTLSWYRNKGNDNTGIHNGWTRTDVSTNQKAVCSVAVADFTGDGRLDIAVGSVTEYTLSYWKQSESPASAGSFALDDAVIIDTAFGGGGYEMKAADLSGDGSVDLAVASVTESKLYYYKNVGGGTAFTRYVLDAAANNVRGIALCDLDGDGHLEIVTTSSQDGKVSWYKESTVSLVECDNVLVATQAHLITKGDVDDAGLVGLNVGTTVTVTSADDFDDSGVAQTLTREIAKIEAAKNCFEKPDVALSDPADKASCEADGSNGNGKTSCELVKRASDAAETACVWKNDGNKKKITFTAATSVRGSVKINAVTWSKVDIDSSMKGARSVICEDLDDDGDNDLAVVSDIKQNVRWYQNDGAAAFSASTITDGINGASAIAAGDMNSDAPSSMKDLVFGGIQSVKEGIASRSCKDQIPVGFGRNQDCTKLIAYHDCTQTCSPGYEETHRESKIYSCTHAGELQGTLLECKKMQCLQNVDNGVGYFSMDPDKGYSKGEDDLCADLDTDEECTHTCLKGFIDNNGGNGQVYKCSGGVFAGSVLICEPDSCTDEVPDEPGMDQGCNSLVTGATCKHMCTQGYTDASGGQGQQYTCSGGVFAGTDLVCVPNDCSASVPVGKMYAVGDCSDLKTDGTCVQKCAHGFIDNNGGNGQEYTCGAGVFKGTLLMCRPAACASAIPSGVGYSTECKDLRTDGNCTQHCTPGYKDNNDGEGQRYTCEKGVFVQANELVCLPEKCSGSIPEGPGFDINHECTSLEADQSCTHTCNKGYEDNSGSHGLLGLGKEYACPAGVRGAPASLNRADTTVNLMCNPASCAAKIPATPSYTKHCNKYKIDGPACVQYCQHGHYPVNPRNNCPLTDDGSRRTHYTCDDSFLKATSELVCQAEACNEKVPTGPGFGTECSALTTDGSCVHTCTAGYTDNNNGNGQIYSCPGRVFTAEPDMLTCTADLCNASVPTGIEYTSDCSGLMTDGYCIHRCAPGYEDERENEHGVKLYGDKHFDLTSVGVWADVIRCTEDDCDTLRGTANGKIVVDPVLFDNNGANPFWKYHRQDQQQHLCRGKSNEETDDSYCRGFLENNCDVRRCHWKSERFNVQEWWQPQDGFMHHGKWNIFTTLPRNYDAEVSHTAVTNLADGVTRIAANKESSIMESYLAPTYMCKGNTVVATGPGNNTDSCTTNIDVDKDGNSDTFNDEDCKPYAKNTCKYVSNANGERKCEWKRQIPTTIYRNVENGYGFKEYETHPNGIGKEIGKKAVIYSCPAGKFTPWKGEDKPKANDVTDVGQVLKCVRHCIPNIVQLSVVYIPMC